MIGIGESRAVQVGSFRDFHIVLLWRPFLVYYAEGPGYALVGEPDAEAASPVLFQTADRVTVEHLAFQLQRALGVPITR